jgi:hypothetical protein
VPYFSISSPGPSEFGTMTMTQASGEREPMRPSTSDCACGEKPSPPCSLEMSIPRKPCFLTKLQTSGGTSRSLWRISQSLSIRQSSLQGPSRNAFSSSVSVMGGTERSFSQSGVPENSSASKPMVPALSASCSVAETLGRMPLILWKIGRVSAARRMAGTDSPASTITGSQASIPRGPISTSYSPCSIPDCQT